METYIRGYKGIKLRSVNFKHIKGKYRVVDDMTRKSGLGFKNLSK
jgi:hypothetical protein